MAAAVKVQLEGSELMIAKLRLISHQFPEEVKRAGTVYGARRLALMVERTPKKTGALAGSGRFTVRLGKVGGAPNVAVTWTFGNSKVVYARRVHEDLKAKHSNGQAKFAESVIIDGQSTALPELAEEISLARAAR